MLLPPCSLDSSTALSRHRSNAQSNQKVPLSPLTSCSRSLTTFSRLRQEADPGEPSPHSTLTREPQASPVFALQQSYIEPTGNSVTVPNDHDFNAESEKTFSDVAIEQSQSHTIKPSSLPIEDINATARLITHYIQRMTFFEILIARYYETSQVAVIPGPLVLLALPAIADTLRKIWTGDDQSNLAAARHILENTSNRPVVPPSTSAKKCHTLFTGQNLRLECLGIAFSLAGLASLFLPVHDAVLTTQSYPGFDQRTFALEMADLSDTCISICERCYTVGDLFNCLLYENLVLLTMRYGDSSTFDYLFLLITRATHRMIHPRG